MDRTQELELGIQETFAEVARQLRSSDDSGAMHRAVMMLEQLVTQLGDVADLQWNRDARLILDALKFIEEQQQTGLNANGDAGMEPLLKLLADGTVALGSALDGLSAGRDRLSEVTDELSSTWGFETADSDMQLEVQGADKSFDAVSAEAPMSTAPISADQLQLILQAMRTGGQTEAASSEITQNPPAAASNQHGSARDSSTPPAPPAPESVVLDEGLLEAFLEDGTQCLASMERIALNDQSLQQGQLQESARLIRRELHTLKGASASIELSSLARYLHEVEDWLEDPAHYATGSDLRNCALTCVDVVRQHIASLNGSAAPVQEIGADATPSSSSAPAATKAPIASPATPSTMVHDSGESSETTLRVKTSQIDRLMDLLAELAMLRGRRDGRSAEFQCCLHQLSRSVNRLRSTTEDVGYLDRPNTGTDDADAVSLRLKLSEIANDLDESLAGLKRLQEPLDDENRSISQFVGEFRQELVQLRRLPLSGLFRRLQRAAFDAARAEGKEVRFELVGDHSGLERSLQERLYEPLLHMVRNAVSHGIESRADRIKAGKDPVGVVTLVASGSTHALVLELSDDGKGLDFDAIRRRGIERGLIAADRSATQQELSRLIFHPGFSTKEVSTGVSGRGVGMDIVANSLERLHCLLEIDSATGKGTRFRMTLPLYSIIEHMMVFRSGGKLFGVPMTFVKTARDGLSPHADQVRESLEINACDLLRLGGTQRAGEGRKLVLGLQRSRHHERQERPEVKTPGKNYQERNDLVLIVDEIVGPEEIVVRPLPGLLKNHPFLSGVTVSGRGEILQLIDCHRLIKHSRGARIAPRSPAPEPVAEGRQIRVLVTDDSISARRRLIQKLQPFNLQITEASDGLEAIEKLREQKFDILFTDLEMEHMNGFDLLTEVQHMANERPQYMVMITSRTEAVVRRRSRELGALACLAKPVSDEDLRAVLQQMQIVQDPG